MWRWDQGRLLYFQFDVLKAIAGILIKFDGVDISTCEPIFRTALEDGTGMPFLPTHYTIKRNYSRVFQCAFLASFVGNKLVTTDMCKALCDEHSGIKTTDDYLLTYIRKFRFPFPAFDGYNSSEQRIYPFCAILKHLLALRITSREPKVSLDDIFNYIIANNCTGFESLDFYFCLKKGEYRYTDTERRQLREMVIFISQLSFLQVYDGYLFLEEISDHAATEMLMTFLHPENRLAKADRLEEYYEMTTIGDAAIDVPTFEAFVADPSDTEFIEGNRKRIEHFRVERSSLLRKFYKKVNPTPVCCACGADMSKRYPWTDYMLDIHHLLPLSSAVAISLKGTSLADIVGLCPSCHRAVHMYYRKWLKASNQDDFSSRQEAHEVYLQATREIAE